MIVLLYKYDTKITGKKEKKQKVIKKYNKRRKVLQD